MRTSHVLHVIRRLAELLRATTDDVETLDVIIAYTQDRQAWQNAHALFQRIRGKSLKVSKEGRPVLEAQYDFEEYCAKTLYNLGRYPAPFDPESPFYIIPKALRAAELLGVEQQQVINAIQAEPPVGGNAG